MWKYAPAGALLVLLAAFGPGLVGRDVAAQPQASIRITGPANGAMVTSPVTVSVEIAGATVKHWDEQDPNAVHYHLLVDVNPATVIQPGTPLPPGQASILHLVDRTRQLDLPAGQHTITAVLTGTDHVPFSPGIQEQVTFTVTGPAPGTLARTGRGGELVEDSRLSPAAAIALTAGLVGACGVLLWRRRRAAGGR